MAEIPVERKRGLPWWLWPLLGALLLLLLLVLLMRGCNSTPVAVTNSNDNVNNNVIYNANSNVNTGVGNRAGNNSNTPTRTGTVATAGALTDITSFLNSNDKTSFIGRQAQFNNVRVQRVVSDKAFTIGPKAGQEMYVVLDDSLNEGGSDRKFRIKEGENLIIEGPLEKPPTEEVMREQNKPGALRLNPAELADMKKQQVYLHANKIQNGTVTEGSK